MMRLDRFLCELNIGTRSQVKEYLRLGSVTVNGCLQKRPEFKVNENSDLVTFKGQPCQYSRYAYFMLHKPAGVVSAVKDNVTPTVIELLKDTGCKDLFPVGRLDKDTEGLLLITNDGELAHNLLSPGKHVPKTYYARLETPLSAEDIKQLMTGVDIGEKNLTRPAQVVTNAPDEITLTIHEGKYHQVKRMLQTVGNKVLYLKRLSMGSLTLDDTLAPGQFRPLTEQEIQKLKAPTAKAAEHTQN